MTNVILCGGAGTRLWPLSREYYPKQFVDLADGESLFKGTIKRNLKLCRSTIIVTNERHVFMAAGQCRDLGTENERFSFIAEAVGRNTAPAIALACLSLDPDDIVLASPSDNFIADEEAYRERSAEAAELARRGYLVTYGITPDYAETGYGYVEIDRERSLDGLGSFAVATFREKPDVHTAESFVRSGDFFWNSGIFVFRAGVYLDALSAHRPDILEACEKAIHRAPTGFDPEVGYRVTCPARADMEKIPAESVDYAVMEKSERVACVVSSFGWSDLGSFDSLYGVRSKDESRNTLDPALVQYGSHDNLVVSGGRKIALVGLDGCIVIDTEDALLVASRGASQDVKKIVERLRAGNRRERALTEVHRMVYRPWGSYTLLDEGDGFLIRRLIINPGKGLSLHQHSRRSEHWVVVSGRLSGDFESEVLSMETDGSVRIPAGCAHRLKNEGDADLIIIETQVGEYIDEDDIFRMETGSEATNPR
jgi:mannose-1-phosphate guanylyltransferase